MWKALNIFIFIFDFYLVCIGEVVAGHDPLEPVVVGQHEGGT